MTDKDAIQAFKMLRESLGVRDYDDELFLKNLPDNEPVSLVIPFERTDRGYLDIFRSYIDRDRHSELSDEEVLSEYLENEGKDDPLFSDAAMYTPQFFRGFIEENEAPGGMVLHSDNIHKSILDKYPEFDNLSRFEQRSIQNKYQEEYWNNYVPKTVLNTKEQDLLTERLNAVGIMSCTEKNSKTSNPSYFVVMPNGILTPFMDKNVIERRLPQIKKCMQECGMNVGGHISPVSFEQLRYPQEERENNDEKIESYYRLLDDIQQKGAESVKEELYNKKGSLFRGGLLGQKAFAANIDTQSRASHCLRKSYAMATKQAEYAVGYACSGCVLDFREMGTQDTYGLLYQYAPKGDEVYFPDRGIERAPTTAVLPVGNDIETPVFPYKNKLENIYLVAKKIVDDKVKTEIFPLDLNNSVHKYFLDLHEPKDTRVSGYLKERRVNQFNEAKDNNGNPQCYGLSVNEQKIDGLRKKLHPRNYNQNNFHGLLLAQFKIRE